MSENLGRLSARIKDLASTPAPVLAMERRDPTKPLLWDDLLDGVWDDSPEGRERREQRRKADALRAAERDAYVASTFAGLYALKAQHQAEAEERRAVALANRGDRTQENHFRASRSEVADPWGICSDAFSTWLVNEYENAWDILGYSARDVVDSALLRAVETYSPGKGAQPESWGRLLARQALEKAIRHQVAEDAYYKAQGLRLHQGDGRKKTGRPNIDSTVLTQREGREQMLLRNQDADGFALRVSEHWLICGGEHLPKTPNAIEPQARHMHRPADHPLGYGCLCLECFERLDVHVEEMNKTELGPRRAQQADTVK
jgi:hypothetical protein